MVIYRLAFSSTVEGLLKNKYIYALRKHLKKPAAKLIQIEIFTVKQPLKDNQLNEE